MQLPNVLAFFALTGFAAAECYNSGEFWDNKNLADTMARAACQKQLSGYYGNEGDWNSQKSACADTSRGKVDLIIRHLKENNGFLSEAECYRGLSREITGCPRGGARSEGDWWFK